MCKYLSALKRYRKIDLKKILSAAEMTDYFFPMTPTDNHYKRYVASSKQKINSNNNKTSFENVKIIY